MLFSNGHLILLFSALPWLAGEPALPLASADKVSMLNGDTVAGNVESFSENEGLKFADQTAALPLQQIWRIERHAPTAEDRTATAVTLLTVSGTLHGTRVQLENDAWVLDHPATDEGRLRIPRPAVRALRYAGQAHAGADELLAGALAEAGADDRLLARTDAGEIILLDGALVSVTPERIVFHFRGQDRTLAVAKVCALVLGGLRPEADDWRYRIRTRNGSTILAAQTALRNGRLTVKPASLDDHQWQLAWTAIETVEFALGNLRFLSDLTPLSARYEPFVTAALPWRMDAGVMGQPLRIGERQVARGLGLHAPCTLVYTVPEGTRAFAAVAGLDPEFGKKGDCELVILGDGRELMRERLHARRSTVGIHLDVSGCQRLTITVEMGNDFDLSDHVNLAEARFLK